MTQELKDIGITILTICAGVIMLCLIGEDTQENKFEYDGTTYYCDEASGSSICLKGAKK